ncbi:MFS transporter [Bdellovibrio bacteriovorus]|uniref:MFS transporter n=1 Tax=Bdellovibrio bacteriovorus TaxID=959 RepID=UPI0021CED670|nr:MFS transporter [Bdellovibrio bacteriovorus]UXR66078.1 MFS transporter [Bdellovibrio bacteriovorus]
MKFTGYQKFVIALLAFLQFTIILDFMILSPLGALLMPALKITASQFGTVVSAYAISAAVSSMLTAGFADRFDRKKLLLFFYGGFVLGTLFCALAPNFGLLLTARIVTGIFGGVIGSISFAIMTDIFPLEQRGRVMGFMQTAFAASQVLGLPIGLYLSTLWGWHAPFLMIVAVSAIAGIFIWRYLQPLTGHLALQTDKKAYLHLWHTLTDRQYILPFVATALLSIGGFMIMPFASAFTVNNLGIAMEKLPVIYMITGLASIMIGPLIGKASDTYGGMKVFFFGTLVSSVMVMVYTHLGLTPLWMVIVVNVAMFVGIFSRMIPSQTLMSAIPSPANRGSFMSVSSSLQQLAGGLGAIIAGAIVVQESSGLIRHFEVIGYIMVGLGLLILGMMFYINRAVENLKAARKESV